MSKPGSTRLFELIKSLTASEKRYFKVMNETSHGKEGKKFIRLFELIDGMQDYSESLLLKEKELVTPGQLSNLKANLYKKILASLKQFNSHSNQDMVIREYISYAQLLFDKSLYDQCEVMIKKALAEAKKIENLELQLVALKWEKRIISQTVKGDSRAKAKDIVEAVDDVNSRINNINRFTNIQLELYALYLKIGFIRNESDLKRVQKIFNNRIPQVYEEELSLGEKSNLYSLYVDYFIFTQDFERAYEYAKKFVGLFSTKHLIEDNMETYIKALNSLMICQNRLYKIREFNLTKRKLRGLQNRTSLDSNKNISLKLFKYIYVHEFNGLFMAGEFSKGVKLMSRITPRLEEYIVRLDSHSRLIMYYKIACLYVGASNFSQALVWLNKILNTEHIDLREDIHGFARILSLICHYELGHTDVIDYYIRSTYRFLLKKKNLQQYQKYILNFLKRLNTRLSENQLLERFEHLREQLLPLEKMRFEKRAFIYFDIISWLESKLYHQPVEEIIQQKGRLLLNPRVTSTKT